MTYNIDDPGREDVVWVVALLKRLRRLVLNDTPIFSDDQLAQLSTLHRLTYLEIKGGGCVAKHTHIARATALARKAVAAAVCTDHCSAYAQPCTADTAILAEQRAMLLSTNPCRCCFCR